MFASSSITYIVKISLKYMHSAGRVSMACVVEIGSRSVLSECGGDVRIMRLLCTAVCIVC